MSITFEKELARKAVSKLIKARRQDQMGGLKLKFYIILMTCNNVQHIDCFCIEGL